MSFETMNSLVRALEESQAARDKLVAENKRLQDELALYKTWVTLDATDTAVMVVGDVDHEEGSWCAVFRHREHAERFVVLARVYGGEELEYANLAVLDGTVTADGINLWNSYESVRRPDKGGES